MIASGFYFATSEVATEGVDLYVEYITGTENFNVYFKDSEKMSYLFNFTILCTLFRKNSTIFTVIYKYIIISSII